MTTITEEQLEEVGFYKKANNNRISRVPRLMSSISEEASAEGSNQEDCIVGISLQDYGLLTKYVLSHIQTAFKLKLPGQKDCERLDSGGSNGRLQHCKIPINLGINLPEKRCLNVSTSEEYYLRKMMQIYLTRPIVMLKHLMMTCKRAMLQLPIPPIYLIVGNTRPYMSETICF